MHVRKATVLLAGALLAAAFVSIARAEFKPYDAAGGLLWHLSGENAKLEEWHCHRPAPDRVPVLPVPSCTR